jgi:hypothetical protein
MRVLIVLFCLLLSLTSCAAPNQAAREQPLPNATLPAQEPPTAAPLVHLPTAASAPETSSPACPLSEPSWAKPPEDAAVQNPPVFGHYFVNDDRSIWASAWWAGQDDQALRVSQDGIKVGWFRPAGATLEITGRRTDAQAPALEADVPCCYPTRFQATGLRFPSEGCWEVIATAADSRLSFVVWVEP